MKPRKKLKYKVGDICKTHDYAKDSKHSLNGLKVRIVELTVKPFPYRAKVLSKSQCHIPKEELLLFDSELIPFKTNYGKVKEIEI